MQVRFLKGASCARADLLLADNKLRIGNSTQLPSAAHASREDALNAQALSNGECGRHTAFMTSMEDVLDVHAGQYDAQSSLMCVNEGGT